MDSMDKEQARLLAEHGLMRELMEELAETVNIKPLRYVKLYSIAQQAKSLFAQINQKAD